MSVVLKQQFKRNSINDLFYFEVDYINNTFTSDEERFPNIFKGLISHQIEEAITWQEFYDRWDELRSDLKVAIPRELIQEKIDSSGNACYFNPFELTRTVVLTFNDLDSFIDTYNTLASSEFNNIFTYMYEQARLFNYVISEKLYIDGVETPFPPAVTSLINAD